MKKNGLKIVAALIGVAGAYFIYRYIKGNKKSSSEPIKKGGFVIDVPPPEKISEVQFNVGTDKFPLGKGSRGSNVVLLQQALTKLSTDGIFGNLTEAALFAQTGKKSVASANEIIAIANKNGFGYKMDSNGKIVLIPKSQQNILIKDPSNNKLPLFGSL
jgi:hypothetical protein